MAENLVKIFVIFVLCEASETVVVTGEWRQNYLSYYINRFVCVCVCVCVRARVCVCVCINAYSSYTVGRMVSKFCLSPQNPHTGICRYLARNCATLPSGGNGASSPFSWRKV